MLCFAISNAAALLCPVVMDRDWMFEGVCWLGVKETVLSTSRKICLNASFCGVLRSLKLDSCIDGGRWREHLGGHSTSAVIGRAEVDGSWAWMWILWFLLLSGADQQAVSLEIPELCTWVRRFCKPRLPRALFNASKSQMSTAPGREDLPGSTPPRHWVWSDRPGPLNKPSCLSGSSKGLGTIVGGFSSYRSGSTQAHVFLTCSSRDCPFSGATPLSIVGGSQGFILLPVPRLRYCIISPLVKGDYRYPVNVLKRLWWRIPADRVLK